jgi:hypothetical protein
MGISKRWRKDLMSLMKEFLDSKTWLKARDRLALSLKKSLTMSPEQRANSTALLSHLGGS